MVDVTLMAAIRQSSSEAPSQVDLEVNTALQNGPQIRRQAAADKIGADAVSWEGCKTELLWDRIHTEQGVFESMTVFLDSAYFINHLRHSCPFLYKIQARTVTLKIAGLEHQISASASHEATVIDMTQQLKDSLQGISSSNTAAKIASPIGSVQRMSTTTGAKHSHGVTPSLRSPPLLSRCP